MSGHSKWAGIKHKKALIDAKRGKIFSKIIKEITIAVREGGADPEGNPRLRTAVDKSKSVNMPADNIKKAIQRGTGEIPGVRYEEITYEGYGPGGVAIMVEITTDNKNRVSSEIRKIFANHGGNLGENGCVNWMFSQKGYIAVSKNKVSEDKLMEVVLDAGAEDLKTDDESVFEIITLPKNFEKVKQVLKENKIEIDSSEITFLPQTYIKLTGKNAEQMMTLMEALEDHDDVQNVYANFDIPHEIIDAIEKGA